MKRSPRLLAALLVLMRVAATVSAAAPVIVWRKISTSQTTLRSDTKAGVISASELLDTLAGKSSLYPINFLDCDTQVYVMVSQQNVYAPDLEKSSSTNSVLNNIRTVRAASDVDSLGINYVQLATTDEPEVKTILADYLRTNCPGKVVTEVVANKANSLPDLKTVTSDILMVNVPLPAFQQQQPNTNTPDKLSADAELYNSVNKAVPYNDNNRKVVYVFSGDMTSLSSKSITTMANITYNDPYIVQYQIFSPALFMGLSVSLLLISILLVGICGVMSIKAPVKLEGEKRKLKRA